MAFSDRLKQAKETQGPEASGGGVEASVPAHPLKAGDEALRQGYVLVVAFMTSADGVDDEGERAYLRNLVDELELQDDMTEQALSFAQKPADDVLNAAMEDLKSKGLGPVTYLEMVRIAGADRMLGGKEKEILGLVAAEFDLSEQVTATLQDYAAALAEDNREEFARILLETASSLELDRAQLLGFADRWTVIEEDNAPRLVRVFEGEVSEDVRVAPKEMLLLRGEVALAALITVEAEAELRIENAAVTGNGDARVYADGAVRVLNSTLQGEWGGMRSTESGVLEILHSKVTGTWETIHVANAFACSKSEFSEIAFLESEDSTSDDEEKVFLQLETQGALFLSESTISNLAVRFFAHLVSAESEETPDVAEQRPTSHFLSKMFQERRGLNGFSKMGAGSPEDDGDTSEDEDAASAPSAVVQDCVFSDQGTAAEIEDMEELSFFFALGKNRSLSISRCRFAPMGAWSGIAMYGGNTRLTLDETIFKQGRVAVFSIDDNPSIIALNQCNFEQIKDACVAVRGQSEVTVEKCHFSDCTSTEMAALDVKEGKVEVNDSQFDACSSDDDGGACHCEEGTFVNTVFKRCSASRGAAVYFEGLCEAQLENCHFTDCGDEDVVYLTSRTGVKMINCTGERESDFDSSIDFVDCTFTDE